MWEDTWCAQEWDEQGGGRAAELEVREICRPGYVGHGRAGKGFWLLSLRDGDTDGFEKNDLL